MEQVFEAFENGNASIEVNQATPGEYHVKTKMGASYIILYAKREELADLANKIIKVLGN